MNGWIEDFPLHYLSHRADVAAEQEYNDNLLLYL